MFKIEANPLFDVSEQQFYSFEETAAAVGCDVGPLKVAMEQMRGRVHDANAKRDPQTGRMGGPRSSFAAGVATVSAPPLTGFRALNAEDYERLLVSLGAKGSVSAPDGFPGVVRYQEVETALKVGGVALQERLDKLLINVVNVECLTAIGHEYAVTKLKWLADETPPKGMSGPDVAAWRESRRHARFNAEDAKAKAEARGGRTMRR